jgi:uncharacterized protein YgiM (DUF1202 family)
MKIISSLLYISIFWLISSTSYAESLYVTDRILLGVHQQASEDSPILQSVPSGSAVQLLEKQDDFSRVRLIDGVEGWISSQYLMKELPATAQYDKLVNEQQKNLETLKSVNATLTKRERDVQLLRDELSNAKTTIKEMKKNGKVTTTTTTIADPEQAKKLQQAQLKIAALSKQLEEYKNLSANSESEADIKASLKYAEEENSALQARIALAVANLSGEKAPSPEELAGIRPRLPLWYWLVMLIVLVAGVAGGISWMDYQIRKRHGGFRV